jgi:hypothetical protein
MASPGQLVTCIAEALKIPEPTVVQYDRLLAENGLRSKGGRGLSAAKVTPGDAANLLIAILGSPVAGASIKPAIETCKVYGGLPVRLGAEGERIKVFKKIGFPTLSKLPKSHTLRDGVVALIEAAGAGESLWIEPEPGDGTNPDEPYVGSDRLVYLTLEGPSAWAEIIADASVTENLPELTGRFVYHRAKRSRDGRRWIDPDTADLNQSRSITLKTIRRIAELLKHGAPNE